jgi:hypothetical protein
MAGSPVGRNWVACCACAVPAAARSSATPHSRGRPLRLPLELLGADTTTARHAPAIGVRGSGARAAFGSQSAAPAAAAAGLTRMASASGPDRLRCDADEPTSPAQGLSLVGEGLDLSDEWVHPRTSSEAPGRVAMDEAKATITPEP